MARRLVSKPFGVYLNDIEDILVTVQTKLNSLNVHFFFKLFYRVCGLVHPTAWLAIHFGWMDGSRVLVLFVNNQPPHAYLLFEGICEGYTSRN